MKIFTLHALRLTLYAIALNAIAALADAGYGRGPESDLIAIPRITVLEGRSNTWNQAATDATDWTNAVSGAYTGTNNVTSGITTSIVIVIRGLIKSWGP